MNTLYKIIWGMLLVTGFTGCSKYLEEKSQDEVKPSTVAELQQILMGEVYPAGSAQPSFHAYLDMMTDDVSSNFNPSKYAPDAYKRYEPIYTWRDDMFERVEAAKPIDAIDTYEHYYHRIMGCNVVLDMIDAVRGDHDGRENVRGQALAMRSYFYFMLVNLYGQPYNAPGIDIHTSAGVELILTSVVGDAYPVRSSVAKIYEQVEADLLKAMPLLEQYGTNNSKYRATDVFVYNLLSRLYLYMEKWEEAKKYATLGLGRNAGLLRLASISKPYWDNEAPATNVYNLNSPELIWAGYGSTNEYKGMKLIPTGVPVFQVSPDLQSKYEYNANSTTNRGDLRLRFFHAWEYEDQCCWTIPYIMTGGKESSKQTSSEPTKGMRVAELYLNRAESNIQLYLKNNDESLRTAALEDLNFLRFYRYDTRNVAYTPVNFSGQALLNFYRDERRRELSFEDHRWFDLRRYGMPEIHHKLQTTAGQAPVDYVLAKGDKRYVLPFRRSVLAKNPALVPNP
ncbi:RagB/SusD family nutrient uptake outer membrane protein [Paraflavitalea soli]|uniref:RagB/SusD family nutrient uptake outer membrane protein n=1 Tax=Paraflavitalea soli TaxID=2315862 RepID=A0A3B7MII1_9BACT|nr:RagB/SusD family nutrient uptake outer membrane protein [Paraflavitalea soli]AXY73113.1 RagB/SusD family nutrient uptake outer membrane protein [Paraflavitalea soli]